MTGTREGYIYQALVKVGLARVTILTVLLSFLLPSGKAVNEWGYGSLVETGILKSGLEEPNTTVEAVSGPRSKTGTVVINLPRQKAGRAECIGEEERSVLDLHDRKNSQLRCWNGTIATQAITTSVCLGWGIIQQTE